MTVVLAIFAALAEAALAQEITEDLTDEFRLAAGVWTDRLRPLAQRTFALLAGIEFAVSAVVWGLRREAFDEAVGQFFLKCAVLSFLFQIEYHFVWVTKYRYHVLRGEVAERCRELLRQSCLRRDIRILKGHVSRDHVHLLVSAPPVLSPAKLMQYLKGRSSRLLQQSWTHLNRRYWGRHMWARGYFCATVGQVTEEQIRDYIERHDQEPPDRDFSIEA